MTGLYAALSTAKARLRSEWKGAVLVTAVGGLALAALVAAQSFRSGSPGAAVLAPVGDALRWTAEYREAGQTQSAALAHLFTLLLGLSWVILLSSGISIAARAAANAAIRRDERTVRRAVGASRRVLGMALLLEIGISVLLVLAVGLTLGWIATRVGVAAWPGEAGQVDFAPRLLIPFGALVVVVLAVILLPAPRPANLAQQSDGEVPLAIPAAQLGFGLAILLAGSLVLARFAVQRGGTETAGRGRIYTVSLDQVAPAERALRYSALLYGLEAQPETVVSLTSPGAIEGLGPVDVVTTDCGLCVRGNIILQYQSFPSQHEFVSPDTFTANDIELVAGRGFTRADDWNAPRVAIVDRNLAFQHFENGDAIGRDIFLASGLPGRPYKVIGIVNDPPSTALGASLQPPFKVYLSVLQHPPAAADLLVQTAAVDAPVRPVLAATLGPGAVGEEMTGAERSRRAAAPLHWLGAGFSILGCLMLGIAGVGTFTMLRLWVRSRSAELNLRRSVGATRTRILWFVLTRTIRVGVGGIALGLFLFATVVRPALSDLLAGLPAWNSTMVIVLGLLLVATAVAGSLFPTARILRQPPAVSLD